MYAFSQGQIFIVFLIIGVFIGVIFDFFRATRKAFKTSDFLTNIQDIIFIGISGILIVNNLIIINNGEIRFYIILSFIIGLIIYFLTISKLVLKIFYIFIKLFKKILFFPFFIKNVLKNKKDFE